MPLNLKSVDPRSLEPRTDARDDHFVELYDDDATLVDSVRTFMSIGISEGDAGIVVATEPHRRAIEKELARSVDLEAARRQGVIEVLDAADTLSLFMEDGAPDRDRFERAIGDVIDRVSRNGTRNVRIFGEMVAVLWMEGNVAGALSLEDCWNGLAASRRFRLFCGYPSRAFEGGDISPLTGVCNRHTHVIVAG